MGAWIPNLKAPGSMWNVSNKIEPKVFPRELVERMVWAGEILHAKLETIPKTWRNGYAPGFNRLVALIDKHKHVLDDAKKFDITKAP